MSTIRRLILIALCVAGVYAADAVGLDRPVDRPMQIGNASDPDPMDTFELSTVLSTEETPSGLLPPKDSSSAKPAQQPAPNKKKPARKPRLKPEDDEGVLEFLSGERAFDYGRKTPFIVSAAFRSWKPLLTYSLSSEKNSIAGTDVNFVDLLGIDPEPTINAFDAQFRLWKLELNGFLFSFTNRNAETITEEITYAGQTFTASTTVVSRVSIDVAQLTLDLPFPLINVPFERLGGLLDVRFGIGAMVFSSSGSITETSGTADPAEAEIMFPVPLLSFRCRVNPLAPIFDIQQVGIDFDASGLSFLGMTVIAWSAQIDWQITRFTSVSVGYQSRSGKSEIPEFEIDFLMKGSYLRVGFVL